MTDFILSCCSTADLSVEHFAEIDVKYVCFHFTMDGKEYPDDLGKSMPFSEFYQRISDGAQPTTSQVNVEQFKAFFTPFLEDGKDILHVSLSSGLSGSYNSACIAREELVQQFPDRKIFIVDSLGASSGYGLLIDTLASERAAGKTIEEVRDFAEENKLRIHHWFFSTDLTSYYRGGRITKTAQVFGTMLNICPLLNMDNLGKLIPRTKCRGKKKVMDEIISRMVEHADGGLDYSGKCFISNSACMDDAKAVAGAIESKFKKLNGKVVINSVGTVIGSHTGSGTVALFFFGDKRTD